MLVGGRNIIRRQPKRFGASCTGAGDCQPAGLLAGAVLVALGVTDALRKPEIVAWASIVFAIPLLARRPQASIAVV